MRRFPVVLVELLLGSPAVLAQAPEKKVDAAPALGRVTRQSVTFLSALREKDAPAADKLFALMLARASAAAAAAANTVSLLS